MLTLVLADLSKGKPLTLIPREAWGALPPRKVEQLSHPVKTVVFTYNTGGKTCMNEEECGARLRELQNKHVNEVQISDIAFNFLIGGDANVYEGRGWDVKSSKDLKVERQYGKRIDIAWIGNNIGIEFIPQHVFRSAYQLIKKGIEEGKIVPKYTLYEVRHKRALDTYYYHPLYEDPRYL